MHLPMRGIHIFEKPYYREIRPMRGCTMRGLPVLLYSSFLTSLNISGIICVHCLWD